MKRKIFLLVFSAILMPAFSAPLHSGVWGFGLDLPVGFVFVDGNGWDTFSFSDPSGAQFDIRVYYGTYNSIQHLAEDVNIRLQNTGDTEFFEYNGRQAVLIELSFGNTSGWALGVELAETATGTTPMLLALAHGAANREDLNLLHMSALDSIIPSEAERRYPGPIIMFGFPRGEPRLTPLALPGLSAIIYENDAEAAQVLVEREFAILEIHQFAPNWQQAWARYYRMIFRDSWTRIADAAFQLERYWNVSVHDLQASLPGANSVEMANRLFAEQALSFVQGFVYERHITNSDFINLVTAVTEGRGDCDNRAMLWAIILSQANIRSAIMVSRNHSHAMGLADVPGNGARFEADGTRWLVAETTANVDIGMIAQEISDVESWLGITFE